ncbi:MAG TPA: ATP/GTP-binding protein [Kouleothrix sp.]|uniref:GTP-binding protein n=1 Tax=Kouleothrix sp. TaxID=2779161 RepID=UPI002C62F823|nr:ATP/GTP-binding protein [Kouleothrix sp.]
MQVLKIVITGAYAAGKTHFIRSLSDIETVSTEYEVTQAGELELKPETTVALDFGKTALSECLALYIFGTPGQERFDYMWELLSEGSHGYVVMVDSCQPAQFAETQRLMARFAQITHAPFVVAANKQDDPEALTASAVREQLQLPASVPIVPCVATDRASCMSVIVALLGEIAVRAAGHA